MFCTKCGKEIENTASFCRFCGAPAVRTDNVSGSTYGAAVPMSVNADTGGHPFINNPGQNFFPQGDNFRATARGFVSLPGNNSTAFSQAGDMRFAVSGVMRAVNSTVPAAVTELPTSAGALLSGIGMIFGNIFGVFRRPKALISSVIMAAAWIWLSRTRYNGELTELKEIISAVIYGGGLERHGFGAFWGLFGMGTVAAAFSSVLYGGIPSAFRGIKRMFADGFSFGSLLRGAGFSLICYKLFTGGDSSGATVAVSGALLALQSVTRTNGFLYMFSAAHSKMRSPLTGREVLVNSRYGSYLAGTAMGFISAGMLSFGYEYSYMIPIIMMILGSIINGLFKPKLSGENAQ